MAGRPVAAAVGVGCGVANCCQINGDNGAEEGKTISRRTSLEAMKIIPAQVDCADCMSPNSSVCCTTLEPRGGLRRLASTSGYDDPVAGGMQAVPRPGGERTICSMSRDKPAININGQAADSSSKGKKREDPQTETIRFRYLIFATGSRLPHPLIRLPKKKMEAKDWLKENQRVIREAKRVLVVGGGALGIRK